MKRPPSTPQLRWAHFTRHPPGSYWTDLPGSERVRFTYSGRAAIYQYLLGLRRLGGLQPQRSVVLVPALHCPTVIDPVLHAGFNVRFYAIDRSLNVVAEDILGKLDGTVAAALFIRYFGLSVVDRALVEACRSAGARVIEDCCHSFLAANPLRLADGAADATVYSFWKLAPSRVGGGILLPDPGPSPELPDQQKPSARDSWLRAKALAREVGAAPLEAAERTLHRRHSVEPPPTPVVRRPAAEAYPYDPVASSWRMPRTAELILRSANLRQIADVRQRNFRQLAAALAATRDLTPLWGALPPDSCPWGFPILLEKRRERDYLMRARGLSVFTFGEVLHPLLFESADAGCSMIETARYLSDTLLCVAIHQDITSAQVAGFAQIVNDFAAHL